MLGRATLVMKKVHDRQERAREQDEHSERMQPAETCHGARRGRPGVQRGKGLGHRVSNHWLC